MAVNLPRVPVDQDLITSGKISEFWARWLRELKKLAEENRVALSEIDASQIISGTIALARISGLTNAQIAAAAGIAWSKLNTSGSSLADLTTRSASDLSSGLLALTYGGTHADLSATGGASPDQYLKQAGAGADISVGVIAEPDLPSGIDAAKIADGSVSNTEFQYLDGAVSNLQQQFNNKLPHLMYRRVHGMLPGIDSTNTYLFTLWPSTTVSASGTIANTVEAAFVARKFTSPATATPAGFYTTVVVETLTDPCIWFRVRTGADLTNVRIWVGLATQSLANQDSLATAHIAAFRYSTVVPDGGWVGVCQDADASFTVSSTVAAIATSTEYLLRIRVTGDGTSVGFMVDGGTEQVVTTNLPSTTTALFPVVKITAQETVDKSLEWAGLFVEEAGMTRDRENPV